MPASGQRLSGGRRPQRSTELEPSQSDDLSRREILRKAIHIAVGSGAFTIAFLGPAYSALLTFGLLIFNAFVWPTLGGRSVWRDEDAQRGVAVGIVLYPLILLLLVLVFWHQLEVVAVIWAILAFGDGLAAAIGSTLGRSRLPWNRAKSWAGSLAFWFFGSLGAAAALGWTRWVQDREVHWPFIVATALLTGLIAAWVESQPIALDDNLTVPLVSAVFLAAWLPSERFWITADLWPLVMAVGQGAAVTLALATVAFALRAIDLSGAVAGGVLGTTIYAFLGWQGLMILAAFVGLGAATTRWGYRAKARRGLAQEAGGRRSAGNALANAGVAAVAATLAVATPHTDAYLAAFAGAFAAATNDTMSSEVGQLRGDRTFLITSWRTVPPGTHGGVSLVGSFAGITGGACIAGLGGALGFYPAAGIFGVTMAGWLGSIADSLAGATLERRGLLDNHSVNVLNTLVGAAAAAGLMVILS